MYHCNVVCIIVMYHFNVPVQLYCSYTLRVKISILNAKETHYFPAAFLHINHPRTFSLSYFWYVTLLWLFAINAGCWMADYDALIQDGAAGVN